MAKVEKVEKTDLMKRMLKNSKIGLTAELEKSILARAKTHTDLGVPMMNVAFSGDLDLGFSESSITVWAGKSKHFKTLFSLIQAKRYMDTYPDAILLFYDNEFGSPIDYFTAVDMDKSRIIHSPIVTIEELKEDIVNQLDGIFYGDHVFIIIDSVGNVASTTEYENAQKGHDAADMGKRQKALKSLFRIVTPMLAIRQIPLSVINHTYSTMSMYSTEVVSSGQGPFYSASSIFIIGKQQEKGTGKEEKKTVAYNFIIKVEKSRTVKEGSKIPITVSVKGGGLSTYSGLLDEALESGHVIKPKNARFSRVNMETGEVEETQFKESQTNTLDFWNPILTNQKFKDFITNKYRLSNGKILGDEETIPDFDDELEDDE